MTDCAYLDRSEVVVSHFTAIGGAGTKTASQYLYITTINLKLLSQVRVLVDPEYVYVAGSLKLVDIFILTTMRTR